MLHLKNEKSSKPFVAKQSCWLELTAFFGNLQALQPKLAGCKQITGRTLML
jgi:hypothetical protein